MSSNSIKLVIPLLLTLIISLGLLTRTEKTYTINNPNAKKITLSKEAENELWAFYNTGQALTPKPAETKTSTTFLAVGDIMLSRKVALKLKEANNPRLPFKNLTHLFTAVDFAFGNLETPFAEKPIVGGSTLIFASPTSSLAGLRENKFQVLTLANNHALDKGIDGLNFTKDLLEKNNILTTGVGENLNQAWQPAIIEAKGIKTCFIGASYASINDNGKTNNDYVARIEDTQNLKLSIEKSKSLCDFVVASMHAGTEYTRKPNLAQIDFAHKAIDLGADMVIGHHPHWIQTIEKYCPKSETSLSLWDISPQKERELSLQQTANAITPSPSEERAGERLLCPNPKYIFYSLGNFIFDQDWSQETKEGLMLKMTISKATCHPDRPSASEGAEGSLSASNSTNLRNSSARVYPEPVEGLGMTSTGTCLEDLQGPRIPARLESIELLPVIIENFSTPRLANEAETKKILEKIEVSEKNLN